MAVVPDATGRMVAHVGDAALVLGSFAAIILVPVGYAFVGARARRRGIGGSVMAPLEEIWDPIAHNTNIEVHVQAEQVTPAPAPGDPPGRAKPTERTT